MNPQIELFRDDYRLREKQSAKARHVRIEVRAAREVVLIYPRFVPRIEALAFLRSREAWIRAKLDEQRARELQQPPPAPARWDGSDALPLRGVPVALRLEPARLRRIGVRVTPERITLFGAAAVLGEPHLLERALKRELMREARLDARRYLDEEGARLGVRHASLRVNDPRTLWGSCNPGGTICLSWRLVMAPPAVFRYVVVHELCHLVHRNHSARFWALVARQLPEFESHKRWLREQGAGLHLHLR